MLAHVARRQSALRRPACAVLSRSFVKLPSMPGGVQEAVRNPAMVEIGSLSKLSGVVYVEGKDAEVTASYKAQDMIFGSYPLNQTSGNYGALPKPVHWWNLFHQGFTLQFFFGATAAFGCLMTYPFPWIVTTFYVFTNERRAKREANEKYHCTRYGVDAKRVFYSD